MYAKSFIALDGNRRLTGAIIAQIYPYDHLCGSALIFHPEWAITKTCKRRMWQRPSDRRYDKGKPASR